MIHFHPRFTLRTLGLFVTLVCAYCACWEPTKQYANTLHAPKRPTVPLPLVVCQYETELGQMVDHPQRYYLWLLGPKFRLPFESQWAASELPPQPVPMPECGYARTHPPYDPGEQVKVPGISKLILVEDPFDERDSP